MSKHPGLETPVSKPRSISVKRLGPDTEADFFAMRRDPSCDWCFCVAWHEPTWDGWTERPAAANRALREQLLRDRRYDGYLLYDDGQPVGWCQCAPLAWFPKMIAQFDLHDEPASTHVIGCLEILPAHRKRGLSRVLLRGVLEDLKSRGIERVLALPRAGKREDGEVWTGPLSLYSSCGFSPEKTVGDRQVVALSMPAPTPLARAT